MSLILIILLLVMSVLLTTIEDRFRLVMFLALFSFVAACLYFIHAAPDVALTEVAIGCAFIPLIYTIAISRQNTFTVVFFSQDGGDAYCPPELLIEFMSLAEVFCASKALKLKIVTNDQRYTPDVKSVFRLGNTDLIANYFPETGHLTVWGNGKNKMIPELAKQLSQSENIQYQEAKLSFFLE